MLDLYVLRKAWNTRDLYLHRGMAEFYRSKGVREVVRGCNQMLLDSIPELLDTAEREQTMLNSSEGWIGAMRVANDTLRETVEQSEKKVNSLQRELRDAGNEDSLLRQRLREVQSQLGACAAELNDTKRTLRARSARLIDLEMNKQPAPGGFTPVPRTPRRDDFIPFPRTPRLDDYLPDSQAITDQFTALYDKLRKAGAQKRFLAVARTQFQLGMMALNRSLFDKSKP